MVTAAAAICSRGPLRRPAPRGVEHLRGDLTDPTSLEPALREADAVFLVWPFFTAEHAPPVLELIGKHARRLVYLSSNGVQDGAARQADPVNQFHADVEQLVREYAQEWTVLRAGGLAVNTLQWADSIRAESVVREPFPDAARSLVHEADLAAVAVRALTGTGGAGATYEMTGPPC